MDGDQDAGFNLDSFIYVFKAEKALGVHGGAYWKRILARTPVGTSHNHPVVVQLDAPVSVIYVLEPEPYTALFRPEHPSQVLLCYLLQHA